MRLDDYLELVLPDTGEYILLSKDKSLPKLQGRAFDTIPDLSLEIRKRAAKGLDVWVAIGSYNGRRTTDNCLGKKALYIDLDVEAGNALKYDSFDAAWADFNSAVESGDVPQPTIVICSGHGLHCYWVLDEVLDVQAWLGLAFRLRKQLTDLGVRIDRAVTIDAARILRPPETKNYKNRNDPKDVYILQEESDPERIYSAEALLLLLPEDSGEADRAANFPMISSGSTKRHRLESIGDTEDVLAGALGVDGLPPTERVRVAGIALSYLKEDRFYEYSQWLKIGAAMNWAARAYGNEAAWKATFMDWCSRGPGWNPSQVEAKWNTGMGGMDQITIGTLVKMAEGVGFSLSNAKSNVDYPDGYFAHNGKTFRRSRDENDGDQDKAVFVCNCVFRDVNITATQNHRGHIYTAKALNGSSGREFDFMATDVSFNSGGVELATELGKAGIDTSNKNTVREIRDLFKSFMEHLAQTRGVRDAISSFGWVSEAGKVGFAVGNGVRWSDGSHSVGSSAMAEMRDIYTARGTLESWKSVVQPMLDQGRQEINTIIATAFAGPLLTFTGESGAVISLVSRDSGTGKTTALRAAQSVWGRPQDGINTLDDTVNAVTKKLETLNNLPAYWDEVRMDRQNRDFIRLLFQLSQGKGKARLNSAAVMQNTGTWNTMIVVAGNDPMVEHIDNLTGNTNAGRFRLLELGVSAVPVSGPVSNSMQAFMQLNSNYGVAGEIYADYLVKNYDVTKTAVKSTMEKLDKHLSTSSDERFWLATISSLLIGAKQAELAGLAQFDVPAMAKYLIAQFHAHRQEAKKHNSAATAVLMLQEFLTDNKPSSIVTDIIYIPGSRGGRPPSVDIVWPQTRNLIRHPLVYQRGVSDNKLLIKLTSLKKWLYKDRSMSSTAVIDELKKMGMVEVPRTILGAGTVEPDTIRSPMLLADLTSPALAPLFAEDD